MNKIKGEFDEVDWYGEVRMDGEILDPKPSQKIVNHSPDGFAWGYGGSGPAQLALAILLAAGCDEKRAVRWYQLFKQTYIATLPQNEFVLEVDVMQWVSLQEMS